MNALSNKASTLDWLGENPAKVVFVQVGHFDSTESMSFEDSRVESAQSPEPTTQPTKSRSATDDQDSAG